MHASCGHAEVEVRNDLEDALMSALHHGPVSLRYLIEAGVEARHEPEAARRAVFELLYTRRALVRMPLEALTDDALVQSLDLQPGATTVTQATGIVGDPTCTLRETSGDLLLWTLCAEIGEVSGARHHRIPHPYRDALNPARPNRCNLPFSTLCLGEAIDLEATFDASGRLLNSRIYARPV